MFQIHGAESLVLASGSPRRKELLKDLGLRFEVLVSDCDESVLAGEEPSAMVARLAQAKARTVAEKRPSSWVIGADTTVVIDGEILGKPESATDAKKMLGKIQGRTHEVWGGLSIVNLDRKYSHVETHVSQVKIASLSFQEIAAYVRTGEPLDKAGSYAIQGIGASFVEEVVGSYTNVVGMNSAALVKRLVSLHVIDLHE